jgi:hypothetical protein
MPEQHDIDVQQDRLATYRGTLSHYLDQQASLSKGYMPPGIRHGIDEARTNIKRIKKILRSWGVSVVDHPDDEDKETQISTAIHHEENIQSTTQPSVISSIKNNALTLPKTSDFDTMNSINHKYVFHTSILSNMSFIGSILGIPGFLLPPLSIGYLLISINYVFVLLAGRTVIKRIKDIRTMRVDLIRATIGLALGYFYFAFNFFKLFYWFIIER